jgi:hypothetical protein
MPAPKPVPPEVFKDVLLKHGFEIKEEDQYNWMLFKEDSSFPVIGVPKIGELIALDTMMGILDIIEMNDGTFFELISQIQN